MKAWLEEKRLEIEARIARLRSRSQRIEAHHAHESRESLADPLDRAQLHDNDEVVDALGVRTDEDLRALEAALARILDGTYGVCAACGEPIAHARLDALPATPFCLEHAGGGRGSS